MKKIIPTLTGLNIQDYNYYLPKEKIAEFPLEDRSGSKLLFCDKSSGEIRHHGFVELPMLLPKNTILVRNVTKVIAARLNLLKTTGGKAELLCVNPLEPSTDPQITMQARGNCRWECIVGGKKIRVKSELHSPIISDNIDLKAKIIDREDNKAIVEFSWTPENLSFSDILNHSGAVPLPPYIKRKPVEKDKEQYQTVYAENDGSVAAPTAGLHFNTDIINSLKDHGIPILDLTLHVGPGTFKPIDEDDISKHKMHNESIFVDKHTIEALKNVISKNSYIIATGTTSLRTLESLYWIGVKLLSSKDFTNNNFVLKQWDAYNLSNEFSVAESLNAIIQLMDLSKTTVFTCRTELFIVPGYDFKIVRGLITNYHLPKSTLILLVAAFLGDELWQKVYQQALDNDYRFLSYGDSSLLLS